MGMKNSWSMFYRYQLAWQITIGYLINLINRVWLVKIIKVNKFVEKVILRPKKSN